MLIPSWLVVVVVRVACCCCILLRLMLMLVLTFAPYTLTFGTNTPLVHMRVSPIATCAGGAFHSAPGTNTPLAHVVVSHSATCAGGVFLATTGANTALAVEQLALCGGGLCTWYT